MNGPGLVFRRIHRPPADLVRRGLGCPMSDLYEALSPAVRDRGLMTPAMRPLNPGTRIFGPAVTASCGAGDNLMMHRALLLAEPGDVLVVQGGEQPGAQWGHLAAVQATRKGLGGVVVDGPIRDCDALIESRYPVWSTSVSPAHPDKRAAGSVNVPIVCGSVAVRPGDLVAADADGVLVIRPEDAEAAVAGAEERARREAGMLAAIERGRTLFQLHGLEAAFAACGVTEHDAVWDDGSEERRR